MLKSEGGSPSQLMLPQPEHWQLAVLVGPTKAIGLTIKRVMDLLTRNHTDVIFRKYLALYHKYLANR